MNRLLVIPLLLILSNTCLAWSAAGHEAVCEIAYQELTPAAKAAVDALVAEETDERYQSFRDACVWPDSRNSLTQSRRDEHYINLPRNWYYIRYERCEGASACLFTAIRQDVSVLSSDQATAEEKWAALKFLGHWVGDIHQPLHVSYADDRGGNNLPLAAGFGCPKKLHSVWDQCIPEDIMQELGFRPSESDQREDFGKALQALVSAEQRAEWSAVTEIREWAEESLEIARRADVQYCVLDGNTCNYSEDYEEYDEHDAELRELTITSAYEDQFHDVVTERLQQAGVRLGHLLNQIFNP